MTNQPNNAAAPPITASITPPTRLTVPDAADYHMISDYQLTQLEKPETGVLGTIGWTASGGAIGYAVGARRAISAAWSGTVVQADDMWSAVLFVGLAVAGVICLILHFRSARSLKTLAADIRSRQRHISI